ncbi:MAG: ribosomal protein [Rickettsiaceae bacterium]|jgi:large subunit ribosomal protein L6|nr:ribosomal protein [Rickettsiaceae bacterium]
MSRVGKSPVVVPKDVQVTLSSNEITIKGKLGELKAVISDEVTVTYSEDKIQVQPANDTTFARAMWGTVRNNINNMVKGVSEGYTVELEIFGVGFKAATDGKMITLSLGFSHEIKYALPTGIKVVCEKPTSIAISGTDKQLVGQIAGELIKYRPVEPYKGKGVFKKGTFIRRKEGKKK